jgi:hypothetical protein
VIDPDLWITGKIDSELRTAILAMTSESQLQRLMYAVDRKCKEIETAIRASGDVTPNPAEKAIEELPVAYQLTERLVQWRLNQLVRPTTDEMLPKMADLKINQR